MNGLSVDLAINNIETKMKHWVNIVSIQCHYQIKNKTDKEVYHERKEKERPGHGSCGFFKWRGRGACFTIAEYTVDVE